MSNDNSQWGTFGDFMGGTLNPLFFLLSLFAIIYTIKIQTEELELTRQEMEKSNITLDKQSQIFTKQNQSIAQQTFESTFYKLLEHHNSLLEYVYKISGKYYYSMVVEYTSLTLLQSFKTFNKGEIKTFFMTFYQILKFISRHEKEALKNKEFFDPKLYTNILRATFDDTLLCLLAINCQHEEFKKYRTLLVKYKFLEHLNIYGVEILNNPSNQEKILEILKMYNKAVFGSNEGIKKLIK
jgi:hypothetical protein